MPRKSGRPRSRRRSTQLPVTLPSPIQITRRKGRPPMGFLGLNSPRRKVLGLPEATGLLMGSTIATSNNGQHYQLTMLGWKRVDVEDALNILRTALSQAQNANAPQPGPGGESSSDTPDAAQPMPLRAQLLKDGIAITLGDRNRSYGDPLENFAAIADLKATFWRHMTAGNNDPLFERDSPWGHSIDMVFNNLGRMASAPTLEAICAEDRYKDGANYLAIAYELAQRTRKDCGDDT